MGKPYASMTQHEKDNRVSSTWRKIRSQILQASDICWMCGRPGADTIDHLVPLAQGGNNQVSNLRPAHGKRQPWGCPGNYARQDRHVEVNKTTRDW